MTVDREEVIRWAQNIVRMYGTEFSPKESDYTIAVAILEAANID